MNLKGLTINFLGDSITEGVGVSDSNKRYFELIKEKYDLKQVNGFGVAGTCYVRNITPNATESFNWYFASRIDQMPDADCVVVFGGTNDYGHGDAPIGVFSDRTPDTFYGACHDLYIRLIEKYPGKPIVIMTPLHRIGEDVVRNKYGTEATLKTYVTIIREVAEYYSLPVCDLFKISRIQPSVPIILEKFIPDGLHPNDAGHKLIAERLGNFLASL